MIPEQYLNSFQNYLSSDDFINLEDNQKPLYAEAFRRDFVKKNNITNEDDLNYINTRTERELADFRKTYNIPRFIPNQEQSQKLYGQIPQVEGSAEDQVKAIELWRDDTKLKAAKQLPGNKEDLDYHIEEIANNAIREILAKDGYKPGGAPDWLTDKTKRVAESMIKPFYDLANYKESQRFFSKRLVENPEFDRDIGSDFAHGFGQFLTQTAISIGLTAIDSPQLIPYTFATLYGAQYMNESYKDEMRKSGNETKAFDRAINSIPAAALDTFSDALLFKGFGKNIGNFSERFLKATTEAEKRAILKEAIPAIGKTMRTQFLTEGLVGGAGADVASNLGNYYATGDESYLKNASDLSSLARSAFVEGTLGAAFGGVFEGLSGKSSKENLSKVISGLTLQQTKQEDILKALQEKDYNKVIEITKGRLISPEQLSEIEKAQREKSAQVNPESREESKPLKDRIDPSYQTFLENKKFTGQLDSMIEQLSKDPEKNKDLLERATKARSLFFEQDGKTPKKVELSNEFENTEGDFLFSHPNEKKGRVKRDESLEAKLDDGTTVTGNNVIYIDTSGVKRSKNKDRLVEDLNFFTFTGLAPILQQSKDGRYVTFKGGDGKVYHASPNPKVGFTPIQITYTEQDGRQSQKYKILSQVSEVTSKKQEAPKAEVKPKPKNNQQFTQTFDTPLAAEQFVEKNKDSVFNTKLETTDGKTVLTYNKTDNNITFENESPVDQQNTGDVFFDDAKPPQQQNNGKEKTQEVQKEVTPAVTPEIEQTIDQESVDKVADKLDVPSKPVKKPRKRKIKQEVVEHETIDSIPQDVKDEILASTLNDQELADSLGVELDTVKIVREQNKVTEQPNNSKKQAIEIKPGKFDVLDENGKRTAPWYKSFSTKEEAESYYDWQQKQVFYHGQEPGSIGHYDFISDGSGKLIKGSPTQNNVGIIEGDKNPWAKGNDSNLDTSELLPGDRGYITENDKITTSKPTITHKNGWTAFAFVDRTGDKRSGAHGAFFTKGTLSMQEMLNRVEEYFPGLLEKKELTNNKVTEQTVKDEILASTLNDQERADRNEPPSPDQLNNNTQDAKQPDIKTLQAALSGELNKTNGFGYLILKDGSKVDVNPTSRTIQNGEILTLDGNTVSESLIVEVLDFNDKSVWKREQSSQQNQNKNTENKKLTKEVLPIEPVEEIPQDVKEEVLASDLPSNELADTLGITQETVETIRNEKNTPNPVEDTKTIEQRSDESNDQWKLASLESAIQYQRDTIQNSPDESEREAAKKKLDILLPQVKKLKESVKETTDKTIYFDQLEKLLRKGQLKIGNLHDYIKRGFLSEEDLNAFAKEKGFEYNGAYDEFINNWKNTLGKKIESKKEVEQKQEQRRIDQKNRLAVLANELGIDDNITVVNTVSELDEKIQKLVDENDQAFVIDNKHAYFILDQIKPYPNETPIQAVERIFKHEVVGHMKMSKVLEGISPEGFNNLKEFLKTLKYKNGKNIWEDRQSVYPNAKENEIVDEILAKLAEQRTKQDRTILQRIINWIRLNLLKSGQESNWTQQDLEIMLNEAFHIDLKEGSDKNIRKSKSEQAIRLESSMKGMYGAWITPNGTIDEVNYQDHFGYALEKVGEENATSVDQVYNELYHRGYLRAVNTPSGIFIEGHKLTSAQRAVIDFIGINDEKNVSFNNKTIYQVPSVRFSKRDSNRIQAGSDFVYTMVPYDPETNKLGKHKLPNTGIIKVSAFKKIGTETGELKDAEIEFYKQIVPEAFNGDDVNIPTLVQGLQEKGPQVETHVYGQEGKVSEAKQKLDSMTHNWLDAQPAQVRAMVDIYANSEDAQLFLPDLQKLNVDLAKADEYRSYQQAVKKEGFFGDRGPRATSYYNTISPFDTTKFPVTRVDVVLPDGPRKNYEEALKEWGLSDTPGNRSHYERSKQAGVETNKPLWKADNLHENLPNTLGWAMVQFVPDAKTGETVAFVGEQQSRWGQTETRERLDKIKEAKAVGLSEAQISQMLSNRQKVGMGTASHPLLDLQHSLVLKAVIREAQKRGVKKVVVSDGESAMMTEGHDQNLGVEVQFTAENLQKAQAAYRQELGEYNPDPSYLSELKSIVESDLSKKTSLGIRKTTAEKAGLSFKPEQPAQAGGMRLHYDTTLPSEMRKLTGDKGERVDLGVHKNANPGLSPELESRAEQIRFQFQNGTITAEQMQQQMAVIREGVIGSPVFRNPDGTPKSNVTGIAFDISKAVVGPTPLLNVRFSKASKQESFESEKSPFASYSESNDELNRRQKTAIKKQINNLIKTKIEQKLIIGEKNIINAFRDIDPRFLDDQSLQQMLSDLENFVNTRTRQEEPLESRTPIIELQNRLAEYKKLSNLNEFNHYKKTAPGVIFGSFDDYNNNIGQVRSLIMEASAMEAGDMEARMGFDDEDINYSVLIADMQFDLMDQINNDSAFISQKFEQLRSEVKLTGNPILDSGSQMLINRINQVEKLHNEFILHLVTTDPSDLSKRERRQLYYSLMSLTTDGYPNGIVDFVSNNITNLLKVTEFKFRTPYGTKSKGRLSKLESPPAQIRRLATDDASYQALIELITPFRDGLFNARRYHETVITPYLESEFKRIFGTKNVPASVLNEIGIFSHLRQHFVSEKPSEGLKAGIEWLIKSFDNSNIYDKTFRRVAEQNRGALKLMIDGIDITWEKGKITNELTDQDVQTFHDNAQRIIGDKGIAYADSVVKLFDTLKPLSRLTTEYAYGREFDEIVNFVPSMSIIMKGPEGSEVDISHYRFLTDNKAVRDGTVGYRSINTTGSSVTKDRMRSLHDNRSLILNLNYLADSVGRLAVHDFFTSFERRDIQRLLTPRSKEGKMLAEFLGDPEGREEKSQVLRNALETMWQNVMSQSSYMHPWHQTANWLFRKFAQSKLSGVHQVFSQTISNTIPFFVQNIANPRKMGNYIKALQFYAKFKAGALDDPILNNTIAKIIFEIKNRRQENWLDKSVNLNERGLAAEWVKENFPKVYDGLGATDKFIENGLLGMFRISDYLSGVPMMLAEYLSNEQTRLNRPELSFNDLVYNAQSYVRSLDEVERFLGIGDNSRRGEYLTNRNASVSLARNLLISFRSFSIGNATNFMAEYQKLMDGDLSTGDKLKSLRYMGGIVAQSLAFTIVKRGVQLMIGQAIINALKDKDDDKELKELYYKSQNKMTKEERRVIDAEIYMRQKIRQALNVNKRNEDERVLFINTVKDAANNMFLWTNLDFITEGVIHIGLDKFEEQAFNEIKQGELAQLRKLIERNKKLNNKSIVAKLEQKLDELQSQEFISASFEERGYGMLGGSFGGTAKGIQEALDSATVFFEPKAISAKDMLTIGSAIGLSQPDILRMVKTMDKIQKANDERDEKIQKARLQ